jgi:hypothetical protein
VTINEGIAEMFAWQAEQRYRLRTGRRAYTGPAYRAGPMGGLKTQTGVHSRSVTLPRSLSLDGIRFGRG